MLHAAMKINVGNKTQMKAIYERSAGWLEVEPKIINMIERSEPSSGKNRFLNLNMGAM
jgi:hypothetical protein